MLQPIVTSIIPGGASVSQATLILPTPIAAGDSGGTWNFRFFESFDDPGVDARWESLVIQLDDGLRPQAANLGALNQFPVQIANQPIAAGEAQWYKIVIVDDVSAATSKFLDIDTEGSATTNDTELGLYDDHGRLVATDDDDGSSRTSQLTFGSGTRPPTGTGEAYNGRDGALPAGVYYLAVTVFNTEFKAGGWRVIPPATGSGTITLNIRTNTGTIECLADFNRSGSGEQPGLLRLPQRVLHRLLLSRPTR